MNAALVGQLALPLALASAVVAPAPRVRRVVAPPPMVLTARLDLGLLRSLQALPELPGAQLLLLFDRPVPAPASPSVTLVRTARTRGGPDLARPCVGCPLRGGCREACDLLEALLTPGETRAWEEVSSPALMSGRGYDPQFMVLPEVEREEEPAVVVARLSRRYGARLRASLPLLTPVQREVIEHLLAGLSRTDVRHLRDVSRQAIHKDYWAAIRALRRALGVIDRRPS